MAAVGREVRSLGPEIWEVRDSLRVGPIYFPLRMTVMRQPDGGLILWSPIRMDAELREGLAALGEVRVIVAPNAYHHLHLAAAVAAYPGATVVGVPGHEKKRKDVSFSLVADGQTSADTFASVGLGDTLTVVPVRGCPMVNELVAVHHPSGSAVCTDLVFHICEAPNVWSRWFWTLDGVWRRPALPRTTGLFARDRGAFVESLRALLGHSWDQLVMAHGEVVPTGGREPVERWLERNGGVGRLEG
jgi:hypothetical protein